MRVATITCIILALPGLSMPRVIAPHVGHDPHDALPAPQPSHKMESTHELDSGVHGINHNDPPHSKPPKSEEHKSSSKSHSTEMSSSSSSSSSSSKPSKSSSSSSSSSSSETPTTAASATKDPWLTLPLNPNLNVPFYVPTLFGPKPTNTTVSLHIQTVLAQRAPEASADSEPPHALGAPKASAESAAQKRSVPLRPQAAPVNPGQAPATPLPTVIARDRAAPSNINAETDR